MAPSAKRTKVLTKSSQLGDVFGFESDDDDDEDFGDAPLKLPDDGNKHATSSSTRKSLEEQLTLELAKSIPSPPEAWKRLFLGATAQEIVVREIDIKQRNIGLMIDALNYHQQRIKIEFYRCKLFPGVAACIVDKLHANRRTKTWCVALSFKHSQFADGMRELRKQMHFFTNIDVSESCSERMF